MVKFEVYKFEDGQFYFKLHFTDDQVIMSKAYTRKESCIKGIKSLRRNIFCAKIIDKTINK